MTDLKPCPFCGGKVELHYAINYNGITEYYISCRSCCYMNFESSIEKAVSKWNHRHYPPEIEKAVERMKPKKVIPEKVYFAPKNRGAYFIRFLCPTCRGIANRATNREFCNNNGCGQALDWSE